MEQVQHLPAAIQTSLRLGVQVPETRLTEWSMASLLLLLRAVIGGDADEGVAGKRGQQEAARPQPEKIRLPPLHPVTACSFHDCVADEEAERWLVACLQWPRVDRKSAWMQIV